MSKLTNIELKKTITDKIKFLDNYKIDVEIWNDDKEGYYYQVTFFNLDNGENSGISYGDYTTKENCIKEAKIIKSYLCKHFNNVNLTEINI